jgi:hypothetical protein
MFDFGFKNYMQHAFPQVGASGRQQQGRQQQGRR